MIMVNLVTGYAGESHITSADDGALNQAIIGRGCFILEGNQDDWGFFGAEIIDNNTVRIHCGEASMCGSHVRIDPGTFDDVKIDNGQAGMKRYDVIVMTYEKDTTTGIESAYLEVIKGTPKASYPQLPSYESGDIYKGATKCRFMLYEVFIDGVELKSITKRAKTQCSLESLDRFVGDSEYMKVEGIIDSNTVTQAIGDLGNYVHDLNSNLKTKLNESSVINMAINAGTAKTFTFSKDIYSGVLFVKRGSAFFATMSSYWDAGYSVIAGTVPSNVIITKNANSNQITITNNTSSAVAVTMIS